MFVHRIIGVLALSVLGFSTTTRAADVVIGWNEVALDLIRSGNTPPPAASRNLAILHAAIYDAVNGCVGSNEPYHVTTAAPDGASPEAAATAAAHAALLALYPAAQALIDAEYADSLAGIPDGPAKTDGIAYGEDVAEAILELRSNDGSANSFPYPGSTEPGQWRPHESFGGIIRPALAPHWGTVTPFVMDSGDQFRPPPPPALRSLQYAFDLNLVKKLGEIDSRLRTKEQTEIAAFWGYGPGTATPPGHWNQIATVVALKRGNSLAENARLYALLNLAMADAAISCWEAKYLYNLWRPITAIPLADTDGNRFTQPDADWKPLLFTPPFPEYTSGHSTFSGTAAAVLIGFYKRDRVSFSVGSDDLPGVFRSYDRFSGAAFESGMSRIYGGIHYLSANLHGLKAGHDIGEWTLKHFLRPLRRR
jgi:hypothetical protein